MKQQWTLRRRLYNGGMRGLVWLCAGLTCALLIFLFIMLINVFLNVCVKRRKEG